MRLFVDGYEVDIKCLNDILENLDGGDFDDGTFEIMTLDHISNDGDMYFETERYSIYG